MEELINEFKRLINEVLPATVTTPVRFNHCFNRIILDWLFNDCWYNHLKRKPSAISQLNPGQLESAIARMKEWLTDPALLNQDNQQSLYYRKHFHDAGQQD